MSAPMKPGVVLCTACNHTYVLGGVVAVVSALRCLGPDCPSATVYVLDGGIRPREWRRLQESVSKVDPRHRLIRLQPRMERFAGLRKDWGSSLMTYARLLLPELVKESRLIYLDADLVVQSDLSSLMTLDLEGNVIAAARDVITKVIGAEKLPTESLGLDADAPYFQAGVMVIDLHRWADERVSERVRKYLDEYPDNAIYWDQSALNVVLYRRWLQLSDDWNVPAWWADCGKNGAQLDDPVLHFVGPHKPWLRGHQNSPCANRFYEVLDETAWCGWRPTGGRRLMKMINYFLGRLPGISRVRTVAKRL